MLTKQEQEELAYLESLENQSPSQNAAPRSSGLTPEEAKELAELEAIERQQSVSGLESGIRGLAQGASFGFADEITGGLESLFSDKSYEQARDESRRNYKDAQEANPIAYGVGEVGGAIGAAFVPGMGIASGAKLGSVAARGAMEGAAYGLGMSEADNVADMATDAAKGAALGGVVGAGAHALGKTASGAMKGVGRAAQTAPVRKTTKAAMNLGFDLPEEFTEQLLKHGDDFKGAKSLLEIQDEAVKAVGRLRNEIADADTRAWNTLSDKPFTKNISQNADLEKAFNDVLVRNKVIHPEGRTFRPSEFANDKIALKKAQEIANELGAIKSVSERDLKTIVQKIDAMTDWDRADMQVANKVLQELRVTIDHFLKARNPAYKQAMEEVAPKVGLLDRLRKDLALDKNLNATDTTLSKLKNLRSPLGETKKVVSEGSISELSNYKDSPLSFIDELDLNRVDTRTRGGVAQGSRNVLTGVIAGGFYSGPFGMFLGAAGGNAKDIYGRKVGKYLLNKYGAVVDPADDYLAKLGVGMEKVAPKYKAALSDAARRGGNALAVTHFLLGNQDPEYRKAFTDEDED